MWSASLPGASCTVAVLLGQVWALQFVTASGTLSRLDTEAMSVATLQLALWL